MTNLRRQKKPDTDWHPADIQAALRKKGWSFAQLGLFHGYTDRSSLTLALRKPYPKAERIIAETLGVLPQTIWPSRYDAAGVPNRPRGRPIRPTNVKLVGNATADRDQRDMQDAEAA